MRNGLTYREASDNANRIAKTAFDACKAAGAADSVAQYKAAAAYEKEMRWYEGREGC
jgi:hypothetical protein